MAIPLQWGDRFPLDDHYENVYFSCKFFLIDIVDVIYRNNLPVLKALFILYFVVYLILVRFCNALFLNSER